MEVVRGSRVALEIPESRDQEDQLALMGGREIPARQVHRAKLVTRENICSDRPQMLEQLKKDRNWASYGFTPAIRNTQRTQTVMNIMHGLRMKRLLTFG